MAQYKSSAKNSFMLADKDTYSDTLFTHRLYELYKGSTIDFNVPHEIFFYIFSDYLGGKISLDEMIAEADRMLGIYFNE